MRRALKRQSKKRKSYKKRITRRKRTHRGGGEELVKMEHFLERTNKEAPKEIHGVPLVIHRIWHQDMIPKRMKEEIDRSIQKTPEFDNKFYTAQDCEKLITEHFEPNVLHAYKCLKPLAYKADLARYCILYKYGGVYIDSKLEILEPLLPILTEQKQIFVNEKDPNFSIYNGFIACPPNHPVFRPALDEIIENCKKKDYKRNPVDITGPYLLGRKMTDINKKEEIASLPFFLDLGKGYQVVEYMNREILKEYEGYRDDKQINNDIPHYGTMYANRDVFDQSVVFD